MPRSDNPDKLGDVADDGTPKRRVRRFTREEYETLRAMAGDDRYAKPATSRATLAAVIAAIATLISALTSAFVAVADYLAGK